jgi:hypothetical protein
MEILAELTLQHAVIMLDLLLLAQMDAVVGLLAATTLLLTRGRVATLDPALRRIAASSLEKQLHPVTTTKTANRSGVTRHKSVTANSD